MFSIFELDELQQGPKMSTTKMKTTSYGGNDLAKFAWKLLGSSRNQETGETSIVKLHLTSIFISLDTDNDDFLTRAQLVDGILAAGLIPREPLVRRYATAMSGPCAADVDGPVDIFGDKLVTAKKRNTVAAPLFFKTDMATYVAITEEELRKRGPQLEEEIGQLLYQFNEPSPSSDLISVKNLRHILHETLAPTRLTTRETNEFFKSVGITIPTGVKVDDSTVLVSSDQVSKSLPVGALPKAIDIVIK